ncbi:MAG: taurine dioxygenase [Bacteroidia bacterium]|jgi:taurine dioxygenase
MIEVQPSGQACGASVTGVDLSRDIAPDDVIAIRQAWMQHHVLAFPEQSLRDEDLERITLTFGQFGKEPFFLPIDGSEHVVALTRRADEKAPLFAENWHTDWSFLAQPPIGTCLYSLVVPPVGGETSFINQHKALAEMPVALRAKIEGVRAQHSARLSYAPDGLYGDKDEEADRSMKIVSSAEAMDVYVHPLIRQHPESGQKMLFGCFGYIIGLDDMAEQEAMDLLFEVYQWQTREEFQYVHKWQPGMFVMWDNRSVLHKANGGYDGYDRELHRITIAPDEEKFLQASA